MVDKKISEMDAATTPVDYTELIEIVQSSDNRKLTLANLFDNVGTIQLNISPTPGAHSTGKFYWDADAGTMAIMTDIADVVLQVGQEHYVKVRNNSGAQIDNGEAVYITGATGQVATVSLAQANAISTMNIIGLATEDIANNSNGYITVRGIVRDLDTSAFSEGDSLYLSATVAGALQNTVPTTGYSVFVGWVLYANNNNGMILVAPRVAGVLGDVINGNYLEVMHDGSVLFHGDATAWDDLRVPVNSTKLGGSKDPDFSLWLNDGGVPASQGVFLYWFDKNTEEELYFAAQMPHSWLEESDIHCHIHWTPKSNGALNAVVNWALEYTWVSIGAVAGNTTIIYANDTVQGDSTLVANKHYLTELGIISGTGKGLSSMLICRVYRDATGALDTDDYNDDAALIEIDFHFQIDKLGTREEYD